MEIAIADPNALAPGFDHRIGDGLDALGIDVPVFIEQNGGAKHEIAAVPEISGLDIFSGLNLVGLLDELHYRTNRSGNRLAGADVAVLGGRAFRPNAEGHDASRFRCR